MANTEEVQRAYHLGEQDGRNAADWLVDGNTPDPAGMLAKILAGIEDGDPEVLDWLPWPDLSGQWADGMTAYRLTCECWAEHDDTDLVEELCDTYEEGFTDGRDARVHELATYYALTEDA